MGCNGLGGRFPSRLEKYTRKEVLSNSRLVIAMILPANSVKMRSLFSLYGHLHSRALRFR